MTDKTNPFAALLDGVPRYIANNAGEIEPYEAGYLLMQDEVLAALAAAVPADLAEAGKVLEGVTPGPWGSEFLMHEDPNGDEYPSDIEVASQAGRHIYGHDLGYNPDVDLEIIANARFIAWCREGVPALIALATAQAAEAAATDDLMAADSGRIAALETALAAERAKTAKLVEAASGLHGIVEGIQGAMEHGTWRDEKGQRLKDTPEWVAFYNARAAIMEAGQ